MKKHQLLILSILSYCLPVPILAQQNTFNMVYENSPSTGIQATTITSAFDNGYMIAGSGPEFSGLVLKTDSLGNSMWAKSYGISNSIVYINSIITTKDSCFVITGSALNLNTFLNEALCIKLNASGDTLWSKTISQSGLNLTAVSVEQTLDSGYIISGYTQESDAPYNRIFAARLDVSGNLIWTNVFTASNGGQIAVSAKQTPDNGFLLIGYYTECSPCVTYAILIKLNEAGTQSWSKKYKLNASSYSYCYGYDFVNVPDGYLCYVNSGLMKTDFSGNILWTKSYVDVSGGGCINCPQPKLRQVSDGGYVLLRANSYWSSSIVKIDSQGNPLWANYLIMDAVDVIESNNKELAIVGNGPLIGVKIPQTYEPQIAIIQTDSSGNGTDCSFLSGVDSVIDTLTASSLTVTVIAGGSGNSIYPDIHIIDIVERSGCVDVYGAISENAKSMGINIFPNPATNAFNIQSLEDFKDATLSIYNTKMQLILQQSLQQKHSEIDIAGFISGIYFVKITSNKTTGIWKLVKQ